MDIQTHIISLYGVSFWYDFPGAGTEYLFLFAYYGMLLFEDSVSS